MNKKLVLTSSVSLGVVSIVATSVALGVANSNKNVAIKFDNHWFNSYEAAANYYIAKNYENLSSFEALGDINKAMINHTYFQVDGSKLYDFNNASIYPAFESANGNLVGNFNQAYNSFANRGLATEYFTDGNTAKVFMTERDAIRSRDTSALDPYMGVMKVRDPRDENTTRLINLTSDRDYEYLKTQILKKDEDNDKTNAIEKWQDIFLNTNPNHIESPKNQGWAMRVYVEDKPQSHVYKDLFQNKALQTQFDLNNLDNQYTILDKLGFMDNNKTFSFDKMFKNVKDNKINITSDSISFTYGLNYNTVGWIDKSSFYDSRIYDDNDHTDGFSDGLEHVNNKWMNIWAPVDNGLANISNEVVFTGLYNEFPLFRNTSIYSNSFNALSYSSYNRDISYNEDYNRIQNHNTILDYTAGNERIFSDLIKSMSNQKIMMNDSAFGYKSPQKHDKDSDGGRFFYNQIENQNTSLPGYKTRNWYTLGIADNAMKFGGSNNKIKLFDMDISLNPNFEFQDSIKISDAKVDATNSKTGIIWIGWEHGILQYYHTAHVAQWGDLKANLKVSRWFDESLFESDKDFNLAKIFLARENKNDIKRYITYNGKPIFEAKNENTNWSLTNISNNAKYVAKDTYEISDDYKSTNDIIAVSMSGQNNGAKEFLEILRKIKTPDQDNELNLLNDWIELKNFITNPVIIGQLHEQELLNGLSSHLEYYKQYLYWLVKFLRVNISEVVNKELINKIVLPEELIVWEDSADFSSEFMYRRYLLYAWPLFNVQLTPNSSTDDNNTRLDSSALLLLNDASGMAAQRNYHQTNVSRIWVVYDQYGMQQVLNGDGLFSNVIYDDINIILNNIRREHPVRVSKNYVYIKEGNKYNLVSSKLTHIYMIKILDNDYCFATHEGMVKFIIEYIKRNSHMIEK